VSGKGARCVARGKPGKRQAKPWWCECFVVSNDQRWNGDRLSDWDNVMIEAGSLLGQIYGRLSGVRSAACRLV